MASSGRQWARTRPSRSIISSKMPGSGRYPDKSGSKPYSSVALSRWAALDLSDLSRTPEGERHGILDRAFFPREIKKSRGVAVVLEARQATRLRLVGIDREGLVVASPGMHDVIDAAAERAPAPAIENVEGERGVGVDIRL